MAMDLHRNNQVYNMIAEGEVANLLSHFNSDYIMNAIQTNINNRFQYNSINPTPNLVASFELNFKDLLQNYPSDQDNILQARAETYNEIIRFICQAFNLYLIPNDDLDPYMVALNLYGIFVADFSKSAVSFFANYIYQNRLALFESMDMNQYKKDKDSAILYFKRVYNDSEIGVLISKIKEVTYYISGFDIDLYTYLTVCGYNKETCDYITSIILPNDDIFKTQFCQAIHNPNILTDIRLVIQQILEANLAVNGGVKPNITVSD